VAGSFCVWMDASEEEEKEEEEVWERDWKD
jgi:hypothetical protein